MADQIKVAYWPGCVSARLHSGAARLDGNRRPEAGHRAGRTRPRQLLRRRRHRRAQPGARRHAERAHLRARPADRGLSMMNICSTRQGAQSECQQRLDADSGYRAHINEVLSGQRPLLRALRGRQLEQQKLPLAAGRGLRPRPPRRPGETAAGLRRYVVLRRSRGILVEQRNEAARRLQRHENQAQQGGLAGARGAGEKLERLRFDGEIRCLRELPSPCRSASRHSRSEPNPTS